MKVVFIYRNRVSGANSIEELFHNIAKELRNKIEIVEYELRGRKYLISDILRIRKLKADVYHVTGDVHYVINLLPRNKTVLTVHDIYYYTKKLHGLKKFIYKWIWLVFPIRAATKLTTISQETKETLIEELGLGHKTRLIANCYNEAIFKSCDKEFNIDLPVILQIGTKVNKNLPRLISALRGIRCQLVIIGVLNSEYIQLLEENAILYKNLVNLTIEEVYQQYCQSDIVSFISLREGFGVPILEANATGRVIITSNRNPMRQVANNSALLIEPESVNSIKNGILQLIDNNELRKELIEQGYKNIIDYSCVAISNQYYQVYCEFVSQTN